MSAFGVIADITQTDPYGAASDPKGLLLPVAGFDSDKGIYRNQSIRRETFHNAGYAVSLPAKYGSDKRTYRK